MTSAPAVSTAVTVYRIEVRARRGQPDPLADAAMRQLGQAEGDARPAQLSAARVYLIEGALDRPAVQRVADELLTDPVTQQFTVGASNAPSGCTVEVHPLPGVMDPDAEAVEQAVHAMLGVDVSVRTGWRYDMHGIAAADALDLARRHLANAVVHAVLDTPYHPEAFPHGSQYELSLVEVPLRDRSDDELKALSRQAHLFLSLQEMQAIQAHYRALGREPRDIELETLAQTWSEHCVHKTLKSRVIYSESQSIPGGQQRATTAIRGRPLPDMSTRPGHTQNPDGTITIDNLLRSTVAAATRELIADGIDWCLSVFVDNAGIIAFDDQHAVCFKVETHNHPSALEPYGGAATGIGGCIRDIIGTGLAARPIANTDIFCVAHPGHWSRRDFTTEHTENTEREIDKKTVEEVHSEETSVPSVSSVSSVVHDLPAGVLHPRRILSQVVAGVRDYGNRMGIPTVNGAVWFHDGYLGNPLVFAGCVGVMPRDKIKGEPKPGDHIILLGGRTGRDGIHGATFSSAELTDTHADEFSHAVQIGNPVTEKKMLDAILAARDHETGCLFHAITDCGAGGLSSAVGEMGELLGATVHLERVPLKYAGLSPTEIWISEAQERMVLAVPPDRVETLRDICTTHEVELSDLGEYGTPERELILAYHDTEVGRLDMHFLHEGLPDTLRHAKWQRPTSPERAAGGDGSPDTPTTFAAPTTADALLRLLAHPNIASKHWIIRQYDHEVQGRTVLKPLVGARGDGPGDAAVMRPVPDTDRGLAIANGLCTALADDPYIMTLAAIDECVRNLVCVGADPSRIAILDNFCWPGCDDPQRMAALVRAAEACYDGAKAYRTPFISGKDSLNNQFTTDDGRTIRIPPTLLISGFGIVPDIKKCITMDAKRPGTLLLLVGATHPWLIGSHYAMLFGDEGETTEPLIDLEFGPKVARCVHDMISAGLICSAHDSSDGGLLVAAAEMCIAGNLGLDLHGLASHLEQHPVNAARACFGESASTYLLEVDEVNIPAIEQQLSGHHLPPDTLATLGRFNDTSRFTLANHIDLAIDELQCAWTAALDW